MSTADVLVANIKLSGKEKRLLRPTVEMFDRESLYDRATPSLNAAGDQWLRARDDYLASERANLDSQAQGLRSLEFAQKTRQETAEAERVKAERNATAKVWCCAIVTTVLSGIVAYFTLIDIAAFLDESLFATPLPFVILLMVGAALTILTVRSRRRRIGSAQSELDNVMRGVAVARHEIEVARKGLAAEYAQLDEKSRISTSWLKDVANKVPALTEHERDVIAWDREQIRLAEEERKEKARRKANREQALNTIGRGAMQALNLIRIFG